MEALSQPPTSSLHAPIPYWNLCKFIINLKKAPSVPLTLSMSVSPPGEFLAPWLWSGYRTPTGLVGNSFSHRIIIVTGVEEKARHDQELLLKWDHFSPSEEKTYWNIVVKISERMNGAYKCVQSWWAYKSYDANPCKPDPECCMYYMYFTCIIKEMSEIWRHPIKFSNL